MIPADSIECMIARIDEDRNTNQSILTLPPLDLTSEEADIERLLGAGGRLDRVVRLSLGDIGYRLDTKCDGCVYNVHCLTESARQRRPELLGIDPVAARLLAAAGLATLDHLARPPVFPTPAVEALLRNPGFDENLKLLEVRAQARRHTLPVVGSPAPPDEFDVASIPNTGVGHLPAHDGDAGRLLRVYLAVDYDYSENRIGALSAHVTRSDGRLHARLVEADGRWEPDAALHEQVADKTDDRGRPGYTKDAPLRAVRGRDLVEFKTAPWKGNNYADDTAAERELIQRFFHNLVGLIADEAGQEAVPVHFYVWSQGEIRQLIEGCCRAGSNLLGSLRQLLGCREGLEQLIYSCVRDEIDRRFALGWTGRGLGVVASLRWYGRRYHWRRKVNGVACNLDHEFTQNVFDFKTQLDCDAAGGWAEPGTGTKHTFEIRSRFSDSLPAAYWHAVWRTLPDPAAVADQRLRNSIERYNRARVPNMLKAYLTARCHALRWLEENVNPKNAEIVKPAVTLADLPDFHLDRDDVARAALDFLRLDQHVKKSNWIAEHLLPPLVRVPLGRTLPLRNAAVGADKKTITGRIGLNGFNGLTLADLETRCSFAAGSFVRLSPWNGDPVRGQTVAQLTGMIGRTCIVQAIDWATGAVTLESMYAEADAYTVGSGGSKQAEVLFTAGYATLDERVTDFVAKRVDARLQTVYPVYGWFDPVAPAPPPVSAPAAAELSRVRGMLEAFRLPPAAQPPERDQVQAVLDGLSTRVQLLQGPPGTGKTTTTAMSVLVRVLCHLRPGDTVLLAAHTHRALDELLARIDRYAAAFAAHAAGSGFTMPDLRLVKVHSGEPTMNRVGGAVDNLPVTTLKAKKKLTELTTGGVLVVGGTTAGLLKLAGEVDKLKTYNAGNGLKASVLVVDEASMMVFPHFLALATLVAGDGRIMLTGDHRQLAPITAHDWENEDRPPTVLYQPFASAYDAVRRIIDSATGAGVPRVSPAAARRSALRQTFRLPPVVRELIARIYRQDQIELTGPDREAVAGAAGGPSLWHAIWRWNIGVFLVVHDEDASKRSNETELEVVNQILQAAPPLGPRAVAVITPHRAQRSLFTTRLAVPHGDDQPVDTIDTVERLQGGERPTVIVSAAGRKLADALTAMQVEKGWKAGEAVDWETGKAARPADPAKAAPPDHSGAFVAAACGKLGVPIVRPLKAGEAAATAPKGLVHAEAGLAAAQAAWLAKDGAKHGWAAVATAAAAQAAANEGQLVVAVAAGSGGKEGHVAIVHPWARTAAAAVVQHGGVFAPGVLQRVRQDRQAVERVARVDRLDQADDGTRPPRGVERDRAERVAEHAPHDRGRQIAVSDEPEQGRLMFGRPLGEHGRAVRPPHPVAVVRVHRVGVAGAGEPVFQDQPLRVGVGPEPIALGPPFRLREFGDRRQPVGEPLGHGDGRPAPRPQQDRPRRAGRGARQQPLLAGTRVADEEADHVRGVAP